MFLTGAFGYVSLSGWDPFLNFLKNSAYARFSVYDLSVVPLFLLMGQFASRGGLSSALFRAASALIGHHRGGIAMAGIGACAGFGAICGSSLATAATMGQVALPELRKYNYSPALATGTMAAGGTLGILIPPSVVLVIYAILTEQNIAKLFLAALVPGILAAIGYAGIDDLDVSQLQLYLGEVLVAEKGGRASTYREADGQRVMQQAEILVRVLLHRGTAEATVWTCDFSYDYVKINAEYRS